MFLGGEGPKGKIWRFQTDFYATPTIFWDGHFTYPPRYFTHVVASTILRYSIPYQQFSRLMTTEIKKESQKKRTLPSPHSELLCLYLTRTTAGTLLPILTVHSGLLTTKGSPIERCRVRNSVFLYCLVLPGLSKFVSDRYIAVQTKPLQLREVLNKENVRGSLSRTRLLWIKDWSARFPARTPKALTTSKHQPSVKQEIICS